MVEDRKDDLVRGITESVCRYTSNGKVEQRDGLRCLGCSASACVAEIHQLLERHAKGSEPTMPGAGKADIKESEEYRKALAEVKAGSQRSR